jgi:hypothetical protein
MSIQRLRDLRSVLTVALAVVVGIVLACNKVGAQKGPYEPVAVDRTVAIRVDNMRLSAVPMVALMRDGGAIEWTATGLAKGQTLELEFTVGFKNLRGPFARLAAGGTRGRYTLTYEKPKVSSGLYQRDAGYATWKYEIVLRDANGNDLAAIDPVIVGKGGGG